MKLEKNGEVNGMELVTLITRKKSTRFTSRLFILIGMCRIANLPDIRLSGKSSLSDIPSVTIIPNTE